MEYLIAFVLGTVVAIVGMTLPGMVNMTAVSISLKRGRKAGYQFIAGASVVVMLQAGLALFFAEYLRRNPVWVTTMQRASVYIFLILAAGFFYKAHTGQVVKARKPRGSKKNVAFGFGLAVANALAIPFFLAVGTWLVGQGQRVRGLYDIICFSLGAGTGAVIVFIGYIRSADWVSRHAAWLTRNINYVMSVFFLLLAGLQGYHYYG